MAQVQQSGVPVLLSSSGAVSLTACNIVGFYVNSTSSGTLVLRDGSGSGATAITGTITPAVGFHWFPVALSNGCYATIANTMSVTFFVQGA